MPHKELEGYPSVTQVLSVIRKEYLEFWRGKYGNAKCEKTIKKSQSIGTRVHGEIERLLKGLKPKSKNKSIRQMVQNFNDKFIIPYEVKAISIEPSEPLIDGIHKYSGTYDAVIDVIQFISDTYPNKSFQVLADWKTSNQKDNTWPLQLSAYAHLYNTSQSMRINDGLVIRLDKKTLDIEGPIWYTNLDQYFEVFLSCRRLYDYVNKKGLWEKQ